jgi:nucleoside 2-deoxyribosyltransferase
MTGRTCFVVMPFRAELNFFYLYFQRYLETQHGLTVRRGDTSILTKALMEKIEGEIQAADFIIGDVTYSNPNVFYELGIARAARKPIIFLTQEDPEKTPVDLRQFEFIKYDLARDGEFILKLDNAVRNLLGADYRSIFDKAIELLRIFNAESKSTYGSASFEEFQARVMRAERLEGIPTGVALREFLLPKVIAEATDISAIRKMESWLTATVTQVKQPITLRKKLQR